MKSFAALTLILLCAAPLAAQDRNVSISVFISRAELTGDNEFPGGFEADFEDANALGASVSVGLNRWLAVEGAAFGVRSEGALVLDDAASFDFGKFNITPIMAGAQLHFLGGRRIDPYIGAGAAYVIGDDFYTPDLESLGVGRIEIDSEFTYYYGAGIALQLTQGFGLVIDGRYIPYEPVSQSSVTGVEQDLDLSMRIISAGIRLKF